MAMTPQIGSKGLFSLTDPYAATYDQYLALGAECMAVRTIPDLINSGVDVYAEYYAAFNIDKSFYDSDLANNIYIVSLKSSYGKWINIPASYIVALPDSTGVSYTVTGLLVQMEALPDGLDFSYLKEKLNEVIQTIIGVPTTKIDTLTLSEAKIVTKAEHTSLEAARQAVISGSDSDYSKVINLTNELTRVTEHNKALEAFILKGIGTVYMDGTSISVDMRKEYVDSRDLSEL